MIMTVDDSDKYVLENLCKSLIRVKVICLSSVLFMVIIIVDLGPFSEREIGPNRGFKMLFRFCIFRS